ncbi:AI-2E family transporter [uncultured Tyzzerella sp.]|uniref:AI-2E family transporter n=1 Tax=uncultured Tyzzerella sp. TaxID=2321398 RepID=UPI002942C68A|nr:AI-2E family transporter [uncultured Tyzzerella sp.]
MKLPWNKKYLIISFHIVVTLVMLYALKYGIDFFAYVLKNLGIIFENIQNGLSWFLSTIIVVVIAFVLAYLLDPVVDFFQIKYEKVYDKYLKEKIEKVKSNKKNKKRRNKKEKVETKGRLEGTILTYLSIVLVVVVLSMVLVNSISKSGAGSFIDNITTYITTSISGFQQDLLKFYNKIDGELISNEIFEEYISPHLNKITKSFSSFVYDIGNNIISIITNIGNGIVNVLISIVICFYFLKDKKVIKEKLENVCITFLPKRFYTVVKDGLGDVHAVFSGYIRGMLLDASIMAILISIVLSAIGLKFAVIIGIISGFSNVIPYFGALVGFLLAICVALISGEPMQALYATIGMIALQQVDTIFIAPKVVGESVELSPVVVIIALSITGNLFGLWGMVFAIPVFATIKLFSSRIYKRRRLKKQIS